MRIGYSFWGFLGSGISDTPDGGRSHRATLIAALSALGHELVFLQDDRDRLEAGIAADLGDRVTWAKDMPPIDLLWLEWRWQIPGRNTPSDRSLDTFTRDLDRQQTLIEHYVLKRRTPTLIWDKDLRLDLDDPLRTLPHVLVAEAALWPRLGAHSLLFPVGDEALDAAISSPPNTFGCGAIDLVYIGNQYGRDDAFDTYFAPAARVLRHRILGKWQETSRWPGLNFEGRVAFPNVACAYQQALATVLLLPRRYAEVGQMTQRIFESTLNGCFAIVPPQVRGGRWFAPPDLRINDRRALAPCIAALRAAPPERVTELAQESLCRLDRFRVSRQLDSLAGTLTTLGIAL
jgi:hypothetical protein